VTHPNETDRVRRLYEKTAPKYDRQIGFFERVLFAGGREWACSRARGETLEIAVGTGRNVPFYPADVRLTGIDISPGMLEIAKSRAGHLGRDVDLRLGDAAALEFPEESFDTVVCTLGLCSIPDGRGAVSEAHRVLRPHGRFVLLEHVRSPVPVVRGGQLILDPLVRWLQADHLVREPLEHLRAEGFAIDELERSKWGIVERVVARKPRKDDRT
jgi:ubiquinone/menaquinone biosynthesis C-methylase UbiE